MEVIAKAQELEQILYKSNIEKESVGQIEYVKEKNIRYGNVLLTDIHGNKKAEKIVLTFKTNKIRKVKKPLFIIEDREKLTGYDNSYFLPEKHFSTQSLISVVSNNAEIIKAVFICGILRAFIKLLQQLFMDSLEKFVFISIIHWLKL